MGEENFLMLTNPTYEELEIRDYEKGYQKYSPDDASS
jgi:hypothetical protein